MNIDRDKLIEDSEGIKALKELMRCFNWHNGYDDEDKKKFFTIVHDALVSAHAITSMQTEQPVGEIANDERTGHVLNLHVYGKNYPAIGTKLYTHPAPATSMQCDSEPVAWQFFQDGEWFIGSNKNNHKQNTIDGGFLVRDLVVADRVKGVSDERAEFEKWLLSHKFLDKELSLRKGNDGKYFYFENQWEGWKARSQLSTNTDGWVRVPPEPTEEMREVLRAIATHSCHVDSAYKTILHFAISQDKGESV